MSVADSLLRVKISGKPAALALSDKKFSVLHDSPKGLYANKPALQTDIRYVLWAEVLSSENKITVSTLANKKGRLVLVKIDGVFGVSPDEAKEWSRKLVEVTYGGVLPHKKVKVLINPKGGPGKAKQAFENSVKPIFDAAKCTLDVEYTTHRFHAQEIVASMSLEFDAIASLSGDGLVHEIINGLASRKDDAIEALRIPVVPIPTGSANAFNLNLQGQKGCFDVGLAALNVIKGKPMRLNLCSITQGAKRSWSFLTQAAGLMSDLDLGTENLRWMGDSRFIYGYLRGLISNKSCPIKVSMKVIESDKHRILETIQNQKADGDSMVPADPDRSLGAELSVLPEDKYATEDPNGEHSDWIVFDNPILYLYSGMQPYVARDLLQFPAARPTDGLLDVVIQEVADRGTMLRALDGAEYGHPFFLKTQHYFKVKAFRLEPLGSSSESLFSIDGERFPWEPIYVEAHKAMFTTLSLHESFIQDFRQKAFQK